MPEQRDPTETASVQVLKILEVKREKTTDRIALSRKAGRLSLMTRFLSIFKAPPRTERMIDVRTLSDQGQIPPVPETLSAQRSENAAPPGETPGGGTPYLPGFEKDADFLTKVRELGHGSQGQVAIALSRTSKHLIAVKTLDESLQSDPAARAAFAHEPEITASLDHPGIIPVVREDGRSDRQFAMKLIDGENLRHYLERVIETYTKEGIRKFDESVALRERVSVFLRICDAMEYSHRSNVMHCDLKPSNIMIGKFHDAYILDWGLARRIVSDQTAASAAYFDRLAGSPGFMAPEVIRRDRFDQRADVYSLGSILFELVTLNHAFAGETDSTVILNEFQGRLNPIVHKFGVKIDPDLAAVIRKAIAPDPDDRYKEVRDFSSDLRRFMRGLEVTAAPDRMIGRITRWISYHKYAALVLFVSTVFACAAAAATIVFFNMQRMSDHDRALLETQPRSVQSWRSFNNSLSEIARSLYGLSRSIEARFNDFTPAPGRTDIPDHFVSYRFASMDEEPPPNFKYAAAYRQKLSFDACVYKTAPGVELDAVRSTIQALSPIYSEFRAFVAGSMRDDTAAHLRQEELFSYMADIHKPDAAFVYVATMDGVHICYPFHDDYFDSYDPRKRDWFMKTVSEPGDSEVWSEPYVDNGELNELVISCSRKIRAKDGRIVACLSTDISLSSMINIMRKTGNVGDYVRSKMLLDMRGHVIVDTRDLQPHVNDSGEVQFSEFADKMLLRQIYERRSGQISQRENGEEMLYFFMPVYARDWLYVECIDLSKLKSSAAWKKSAADSK